MKDAKIDTAEAEVAEVQSRKFSAKERNKVDVIVEAAAILFDRQGYIETSLRDISTEAGLSKGGIYHYFSSKHEILFYIIESYLDVLHDGVVEQLSQFDDPRSKIKFLMDRHMRIYIDRIPEVRALLNYARALPEREHRHVRIKQKQYASILTEILAEMAGEKADEKKLRAVSYFIFGMYNSIMHWHDPDGSISLDEISEICYRLLMDGWTSLSKTSVME